MLYETEKAKFNKRLERAHALESTIHRAFLSLGWWSHRITDAESAPMLSIPRSSKHTRAPDIIIFARHRYHLIEIKESLFEEHCVALYRHQLTAYMNSINEPFILMICASSGNYAGRVGAITLERISEYLIHSDSEKLSIPIMDLDLIGEYSQSNVYLNPDRLRRVLEETNVKTKKGSD